jgi:hypothetical protein
MNNITKNQQFLLDQIKRLDLNNWFSPSQLKAKLKTKKAVKSDLKELASLGLLESSMSSRSGTEYYRLSRIEVLSWE